LEEQDGNNYSPHGRRKMISQCRRACPTLGSTRGIDSSTVPATLSTKHRLDPAERVAKGCDLVTSDEGLALKPRKPRKLIVEMIGLKQPKLNGRSRL
jgi:hypothetical protein